MYFGFLQWCLRYPGYAELGIKSPQVSQMQLNVKKEKVVRLENNDFNEMRIPAPLSREDSYPLRSRLHVWRCRCIWTLVEASKPCAPTALSSSSVNQRLLKSVVDFDVMINATVNKRHGIGSAAVANDSPDGPEIDRMLPCTLTGPLSPVPQTTPTTRAGTCCKIDRNPSFSETVGPAVHCRPDMQHALTTCCLCQWRR